MESCGRKREMGQVSSQVRGGDDQVKNVIFVVGRKVNMLSKVKGGQKRQELRGEPLVSYHTWIRDGTVPLIPFLEPPLHLGWMDKSVVQSVYGTNNNLIK